MATIRESANQVSPMELAAAAVSGRRRPSSVVINPTLLTPV